jgi:hypothetical protein
MITCIPGGIASGFKDRKQVDTYYFSMDCGLFVRVSYKVKRAGR